MERQSLMPIGISLHLTFLQPFTFCFQEWQLQPFATLTLSTQISNNSKLKMTLCSRALLPLTQLHSSETTFENTAVRIKIISIP